LVDGRLWVDPGRPATALQVLSGASGAEVAGRFGVSRQAVYRWLGRYRDKGLSGLSGDTGREPMMAYPGKVFEEIIAARQHLAEHTRAELTRAGLPAAPTC
jgi:transposase